jgi:acetyl-CoA acetyltransferase
MLVPDLGGHECWTGFGPGINGVLNGALAIAAGLADIVVIAVGQAGGYRDHGGGTAPWTRPAHEFTAPFGLYTAVEFSLVAARHMHLYGTTKRQMAEVAATIRNNGYADPLAAYYGRSLVTPEDVLNSRPIAGPFNLLDCAGTTEGGGGLVLARMDRAKDAKQKSVRILGAGLEVFAQGYTRAPIYEEVGMVGQLVAKRMFTMAGLRPDDVDVCEFYDPFSFEIIRQFEAYGFCKPGEGGDFVMGGRIAPGGQFPVTTDGGTMSFGHPGNAQVLHRVMRAARQLQGRAEVNQVDGAEVAMATNAGGGAMWADLILLGAENIQ